MSAATAAAEPEPWDVCGNLLLVARLDADDAALRGAKALAARCFASGARRADGVACFAQRDGWIRSCFFNPDGSFERVCGNSLLAAAALYAGAEARILVPFEHPEIELRGTRHALTASSTLIGAAGALELRGLGTATLIDSGSPHAVVEVSDAAAVDVAAAARSLDGHSLNLTFFARSQGVLHARTFERGVFDETRACGTGALAVAIAALGARGGCARIAYPGGAYRVEVTALPGGWRWTLEVPRAGVLPV